MSSDQCTVQSTDPRLTELLQSGYVVVGESWGARLRLTDPLDLTPFDAVIELTTMQELVVQELDESWAPQLTALEEMNYTDYPQTPATGVPRRTEADVTALWASGYRVFGVIDAGHLVAATVMHNKPERAETEFTSVLSSHRRRGLSVAAKAASIIAFAQDGVREFGTGGAQSNTASMQMNKRLGYAIEEQWLSLERSPSSPLQLEQT
jgi:hypothetical protein